jgi:AdoMet-dependent heme synthase
LFISPDPPLTRLLLSKGGENIKYLLVEKEFGINLVRWKFAFDEDPKWYTEATIAPKGKLVHAYLNVTQNCPLKCVYCFAKTNRKAGPELSKQELTSFLRLLAENEAKLVTFCGGEPLVRQDIFELMKTASTIGLSVSLITSGQLAPEYMQMIEDCGVKRIQFSLDGINPKTHNGIRGPGEPHDRTIEAIKMATKNGKMRVSVCTTLRKENREEIVDIFAFLAALKISEFRLMRLVPVCERTEEFHKHAVSPSDYLKLLKDLFEQATQLNIKRVSPMLVKTDEPYYFVDKIQKMGFSSILRSEPCQQGKSIVSIASDGSILPCSIANIVPCVAGNIRRDNVFDVWSKSDIFRHFRAPSLIEGCRDCNFVNQCKGGCRCAALGYFGKLKSPDPGCPLSLELSGMTIP